MIKFKTPEIKADMEFRALHPTLQDILDEFFQDREVVITSGFRPGDPESPHSTNPLRAIDIRSWIYEFPKLICDEINAVYQYDHERPGMLCAIFHETDTDTGFHIHLQVHSNTTKIGEDIMPTDKDSKEAAQKYIVRWLISLIEEKIRESEWKGDDKLLPLIAMLKIMF